MPEVVAPPAITLKSLLAPGVAAVRKYWRPFLLLQSAALVLVVLYYTNAHVRVMCDQLSQFKQRGGLVFTAIAAAIAGALLPEVAKAIVLGDRAITLKRMNDVGFAMAVFAINGVMTDFQYRGIAWLIGSDTHFFTVLKKMLFDQFVTTPSYGTPYWVVVYLLRAKRYNIAATVREISPKWYARRVLPLLIPGWCFWGPMVLLVYSLPGPLQFLMFCFASGAWSMLMIFIANAEMSMDEETESRAPPGVSA